MKASQGRRTTVRWRRNVEYSKYEYELLLQFLLWYPRIPAICYGGIAVP